MLKNYWDTYDYNKNCINHEWRQILLSKIVEENLDKINSVLEIGCCSGSNLIAIRKIAPNIKLCGIDINKAAIESGKKKNQEYRIVGL